MLKGRKPLLGRVLRPFLRVGRGSVGKGVLRGISVVLSLAILLLASLAPSAQADTVAGGWPLDAQHLRAEQAWKESRGAGITVAVVDSGCDANHPDLAGQLLPGTGFAGVSGDDGRADVSGNSHGTSIAAIIAGTGRNPAGEGVTGLAPRAKILPVADFG